MSHEVFRRSTDGAWSVRIQDGSIVRLTLAASASTEPDAMTTHLVPLINDARRASEQEEIEALRESITTPGVAELRAAAALALERVERGMSPSMRRALDAGAPEEVVVARDGLTRVVMSGMDVRAVVCLDGGASERELADSVVATVNDRWRANRSETARRLPEIDEQDLLAELDEARRAGRIGGA